MAKEETAGTEGNGEEQAAAPKEKTKVKKAKPAKAEKRPPPNTTRGSGALT